MTRYKIGEVARLLGLTTQALRFYEQEGVLTPQKSDSGTRYYTVDQMVLLLSFKKYRQADFSVQDVVTHFKQDDIASLSARIGSRREALIAQSQTLMRRAQALLHLETWIADAAARLGKPMPGQMPALHLLSPALDALHTATPAQREDLSAFIEAMPAVGICFSCPMTPGSQTTFRFCVSDEEAKAWSLPLEHTRTLPPARCMRMAIRTPRQPWDAGTVCGVLDAVRAAGAVPDERLPLFGQHIVSETIDGQVYLYADIFIPIR